ncbi:transposase [Fusobacterium animalis]|uniref:PBECR3 domain-containing polyvalent protein n=1 Tax=Fusobacterium animalis TaxID=76859 RepID=UPI001C6DF56C|nr:transposase [Fusobacterium animalis]QYR67501.1 transposase [Fusobacterium animalis]
MANQKELVGILNAQIIEYFNLSTNFVYIGEQNKEHIKNKHYEDYSKYYGYISEIINSPDYFGKNPLDNSIELVKEFKVDGTNYVKVALRISDSGVLFARTLYKLNSSKFLYQLSKGDYLEIQK